MLYTASYRRSHGPRIVLITATLTGLMACSDGSGDPMGPDPEAQPTVMVLSDGGGEVHMRQILEDDGITVVDGGDYTAFDGAGLDSVDAVVVLASVDYNRAMRSDGEASLAGFVGAGGS